MAEILDTQGIEKLRAMMQRLEKLEDEMMQLAEFTRDVYAEAKALGFEPKILRRVLKSKKIKPQKLEEEQELFNLYCQALL